MNKSEIVIEYQLDLKAKNDEKREAIESIGMAKIRIINAQFSLHLKCSIK